MKPIKELIYSALESGSTLTGYLIRLFILALVVGIGIGVMWLAIAVLGQ
jgi:hypothetical protein